MPRQFPGPINGEGVSLSFRQGGGRYRRWSRLLTDFTQTQEKTVHDGKRGNLVSEVGIETAHDEADDSLREKAEELGEVGIV
jgi:hypothetical protein